MLVTKTSQSCHQYRCSPWYMISESSTARFLVKLVRSWSGPRTESALIFSNLRVSQSFGIQFIRFQVMNFRQFWNDCGILKKSWEVDSGFSYRLKLSLFCYELDHKIFPSGKQLETVCLLQIIILKIQLRVLTSKFSQ